MVTYTAEGLTAEAVPRALFTADEVAEALAISKTLVRQLTLEGALPCRRIGRLVRYAWSDVEFFVSTKEEHPFS